MFCKLICLWIKSAGNCTQRAFPKPHMVYDVDSLIGCIRFFHIQKLFPLFLCSLFSLSTLQKLSCGLFYLQNINVFKRNIDFFFPDMPPIASLLSDLLSNTSIIAGGLAKPFFLLRTE